MSLLQVGAAAIQSPDLELMCLCPLRSQPQLDTAARLAAKKADPVFRHLHRSKGFLWLATRPMLSGEWSQAGVMLTVGGAQRWWAEMPKSKWPPHAE